METSKIAKHATTLNTITIVTTFLMFLAFKIFGSIAKTTLDMDKFKSLLMYEGIVRGIVAIVAIACIVFTGILMSKNNKRVDGLGLLLAAEIILLIFAIVGMMLGIIIYVIVALSYNKIKKSKENANLTAAQYVNNVEACDTETTINNVE